ncbi:hypothetical protein FKM82_020544 [Ascaphus truei]
MYEVSVLKVTDPSCFWCQIIKGNDLVIYGDEDYKKMFEEMNMLYGKTYRDVQEIMPVTIAVGEVIFLQNYSMRLESGALM